MRQDRGLADCSLDLLVSQGKDSWIQKPNKVSVITRSQLNKTGLPKAASAGPAVSFHIRTLIQANINLHKRAVA